jgi:hypothetical protein
LNGQRIELGDIEHKVVGAIGHSTRVAVEALRMAWNRPDYSKILVAFYSQNTGRYEGPSLSLIDPDPVISVNVQDLTTKL